MTAQRAMTQCRRALTARGRAAKEMGARGRRGAVRTCTVSCRTCAMCGTKTRQSWTRCGSCWSTRRSARWRCRRRWRSCAPTTRAPSRTASASLRTLAAWGTGRSSAWRSVSASWRPSSEMPTPKAGRRAECGALLPTAALLSTWTKSWRTWSRTRIYSSCTWPARSWTRMPWAVTRPPSSPSTSSSTRPRPHLWCPLACRSTTTPFSTSSRPTPSLWSTWTPGCW
mmetsp:Transcript_33299/g.94348  ORF Transcript_33299/g.94348 Transcript_33299/m.94348 type:complete len:226 (+) Transcript_33299:2528-3205(+)